MINPLKLRTIKATFSFTIQLNYITKQSESSIKSATMTVMHDKQIIQKSHMCQPFGKTAILLKTYHLGNNPAGTRRCSNVSFWLYFGRDVG